MTIAATPNLLDGLDWHGKIFSSGWRDGGAGTISITDKSTGASLGTLGVASVDDVASAARAAAGHQPSWATRSREERASILEQVKDQLAAHRDEFIWWLVRETGSTAPKASVEIDFTIAKFEKIVAELRTSVFEEVIVDETGFRSVAERVPLGVVGVIGPFNFPVYLCLRAVIPALAFGNTVVLKPDQQTAVSSGILVAQLFAAAGLPEGVLHVLPGDAEPGKALTIDPHVSQAVALANGTEYGLSASVHSKSLDHARAVARRLRTGMVHINDQTVNDDARAPFGGVGASGNGSRQGGHASLDEYTTWHWSTERAEPPMYPF
jgi:benzaldehyde dehydrogenase (NAD)